jgi:rfaE bifunctional protein nucleotidyltransferase chain/domain
MISPKIFRVGEAFPKLPDCQVVFTNGCFDLLHPGHLHYLREARSFGDILIVGLNSDRSISRIKGMSRPINEFSFRSTMLAYLDFVDLIIEFDEDSPEALIRAVCPSILVKGSDYRCVEIAGAEFVKSQGGRVELVELVKGFSSTHIIQRIYQSKTLLDNQIEN